MFVAGFERYFSNLWLCRQKTKEKKLRRHLAPPECQVRCEIIFCTAKRYFCRRRTTVAPLETKKLFSRKNRMVTSCSQEIAMVT